MNAATDRIAPSITTMIRMDHSYVLSLFHRYKADTPPGRKRALVRNACLAIQVHAQLEEEIFYPALRAVISGDEVLDKSEPEHEQMRGLIGELRQLTAQERSLDAACDEKFMDLMRLVMHHVADEETRLLPTAEKLLKDRLGTLGMEMTRRRIELMRPYAAEFTASTVRSFPVGAATGAALVTAGAVAIGAMLFSRGKKRTPEYGAGRR
jgi:hemerythrin superfamily protein